MRVRLAPIQRRASPIASLPLPGTHPRLHAPPCLPACLLPRRSHPHLRLRLAARALRRAPDAGVLQVLLVASPQDGYAPFYSARVEVCPPLCLFARSACLRLPIRMHAHAMPWRRS